MKPGFTEAVAVAVPLLTGEMIHSTPSTAAGDAMRSSSTPQTSTGSGLAGIAISTGHGVASKVNWNTVLTSLPKA